MAHHLITEFGATGDGVTPDTAAIQAAIDACHTADGGTVVVPAGGTFLTGQIKLRSHLELHLEPGATLKSTSGRDDFPGQAWIVANGAENLAITGHGVIDGSGQAFIAETLPHIHRCVDWRPHALDLVRCRRLRLADFTLRDAAQWGIRLAGCADVAIRSLAIRNDLRMPNADGIDLVSCRGVRIADCLIESGDDAICLKALADLGPCEDIVIANCVMTSTSCAVKFGSETSAPIRNVILRGGIITASNRGIGLQLRDGGDMANILVSDCIVETRLFHGDWWGQAEPIYLTAIPRTAWTPAGSIRNVRFANLLCRGMNGVFVQGTASRNIQDVEFDRVALELLPPRRFPGSCYDRRPCADGDFLRLPPAGFHVENARGVRLRQCRVTASSATPVAATRIVACADLIADPSLDGSPPS